MRIITSTPHSTLIILKDGRELLYSYRTCVAGDLPNVGLFRSATNHSATTNLHVAAYLNGRTPDAVLVQDYIDWMTGAI